jgi:hypothetical protein
MAHTRRLTAVGRSKLTPAEHKARRLAQSCVCGPAKSETLIVAFPVAEPLTPRITREILELRSPNRRG